ncbi:MAG: 4-(cytidine 5'-diphospho)-2-C-methyl-D-erythritol kinase [Bacteroidales bacterium]|nr:4-(cytidine 5'-diphospho)-2-C-methyl-D-erythritol kinase [Bacteroidales bacterium]
MTLFPNAKINIGLYITAKRDDGYHNIESLFYPVGAKDALEFVMQKPEAEFDELTVTGIETNCSMNENLVMKAVNLLRNEYTIPPLKIHLHKIIPAGSGLGGGSSDGAFMLRYLNRYFRLGIDNERLTEMALQIGSDCAFFIKNKAALVSGRGEVIAETDFTLEGKYIIIVYPGIQINTAEAYGMVSPVNPVRHIDEQIEKPLHEWRSNIHNDFQDAIISKYPAIGYLIERIYDEGAIYCSMSGSGSAVYGIFEELPPAGAYNDYWSWRGKLQ